MSSGGRETSRSVRWVTPFPPCSAAPAPVDCAPRLSGHIRHLRRTRSEVRYRDGRLVKLLNARSSPRPVVVRRRLGAPSPTAAGRALGRVAAVVAALVLFGAEAVPAMADPHTVAQDVARTAWDSDEPALTEPAVASGSFGQLFSASVDGQVYAQPLVVGDTVIAATETNDVYGIDGETGAVRWHRNVGPWWDPATLQCGELTPSIGITSTPVYDPVTGSVYLTAKTDDGPDATSPNWYVHALDAATGTERPGWPIRISGMPSNDPDHPFNSLTAAQRPGLLLLDGVV